MSDEKLEGYRLSPQQRRIWYWAERGRASERARARIRIDGTYDPARVRGAIARIVAENEILRTTCRVLPGMALPVQVVAEEAVLSASLEGDTLLLELPAPCADARTFELLTSLLAEHYGDPDRPAPDEEDVQYADLGEWQFELLEDDEGEQERRAWRDRFPERAAAPGPADTARAKSEAGRSADPARLLTAWATTLCRLEDLPGVRIGVLNDGRSYEELAAAVGSLARYLPTYVAYEGDAPFAARAAEIEATLEENTGTQEYCALDDDRSFAYGFEAHDRRETFDGGGVRFRLIDTDVRAEPFGLRLICSSTPEHLELELEFDRERYDRPAAENVLRRFLHVLESGLSAPGTPLRSLSMMGERERDEVLRGFNRTTAPFPDGRSFAEIFAERAAATPQAPAVRAGDDVLDYETVRSEARLLAARLREAGVGPDVPVALFVERTPRLVVAIMGILEAGGAFLPLDPSYPDARLRFMVEDSGAPVLLTEGGTAERLADVNARVLLLEDGPGEDDGEAARCLPDGLAYVIYTSGSTGRPKGTMLTQRGLVHYLHWAVSHYGLSPGQNVPVHSPVGFDLTITSLLAPLYAGATAELLDDRRGVEELERVLGRGTELGLLKLTPSHLKALAGRIDPARAADAVRSMVIGGEALTGEHVSFWREHAPGTRLFNEYGPTETVVGCCVHEISGDDAPTGAVPIGRPIANTRLYVLDERGAPVAPGVAGELFIGGVGVARGYLGRPDLTAERFVPDPFGAEPGGRLYRTGDRCRLRADGVLEFLGRIDHQIKLRGYRIELGEIENALREVGSIREAAVVAREGAAGQQRLVAYVVGDAPDDLRDELARTLPEYMVPAAVVTLDALPLTANGKLDTAALPEPEEAGARATRPYAPPETETERKLAEIWSDVLGVERIGTRDNFFELGGDSILSIQVVSKAGRSGIGLTPQLLFRNQTIAELAAVAEHGRRIDAEQGIVHGDVPATPILRWFRERDLPHPEHYNQAVAFDVEEPLDPGALAATTRALLEHHDALRLRMTNDGFVCDELDPGVAERAFTETASGAEEVQTGLDPARGELLRIAWFPRAGTAGRLLVVVHHLAIDGVSWRILLEDLLTAYGQITRGRPVELPAKTTSFRDWAKRLRHSSPTEELEFWRATAEAEIPAVPRDHDGHNDTASADAVTRELDPAATRALLEDAAAAYRLRADDLLLAAWAMTVRGITGAERARVDLEGHGREDLFEDVDLSRTVGWFTSLYPVRIDLPPGDDPGAILRAVKEQLRAVPRRGVGYGLLQREAGLRAPADVLFNYLGRFRDPTPAGVPLRAVEAEAGPCHAPEQPRSHDLIVTATVRDDVLALSFGFSRNLHERSTIERLADEFVRRLRGLLEHCASPEAGGATPSDFPLAQLDAVSLDRLVGKDRNVEDLYPLSPVQSGMLFHTLYEPEQGLYFEQVSCAVHGEIDVDAFRAAWQKALDRHAILRSRFVWKELERPLQVVEREVTIPFEAHDWRSLAPAERTRRFGALLEADVARGFDLDTAPLMRLALVREDDRAWRMVWSHHHLLLDGWSLAALLKEVMLDYEAGRRGVEAPADRTRPYRDFIAWLGERDPEEADGFWRDYLAGRTGPTSLGIERARTLDAGENDHAEESVELSRRTTVRLDELSRAHQLTLNTLVQGAWSLLLSRYSGERDVLYGTTVAGRSGDLPGLSSMLGVFINTLPARVDVDPHAPLASWLEELQERAVATREFETSPLTRIHGVSEVPRDAPLFESLLVFENYPIDESLRQREASLEVSDVRYRERTNYALTLIVAPGARLSIRAAFDRRRYEDPAIRRMLGHLRHLLESFAATPERTLAELGLLSATERRDVLALHPRLPAPRPAGLAHEYFERSADADPDAVAVTFSERRLSYGELERRANRVAHFLRARGVGPGTAVPILAERSPELIVGMLAVLKAGGAYVPIDPAYPEPRIRAMLRETAAPVVLDRATLAEADDLTFPDTRPEPAAHLDDLGYVIYTSGSTGRPKGVSQTHRALANLLEWQLERSKAISRPTTLQFASPSFDVSFQEIFSTFGAGGRLVLIEEGWRRESDRILRLLASERVERLFVPFVALQSLAEARAQTDVRPESLRQVITAGEQLRITPEIAAWFAESPEVRLENHYGPTESHVITWHELEGDPTGWPTLPPIGRPLPGTSVYVLGPDGEPVPTGLPGELYLGGVALAREYRADPAQTAERFVPDPFAADGSRLYRSGDLGRLREDGTIEFLGRIDHQVKIRGFRVEPGEIEAALTRRDDVAQAAVVAREDRRGERRLVAYVVAQGGTLDPVTLQRDLGETLPSYMVPAAWVLLDSLPLSPNGKIDRKRLPAPDPATRDASAPFVAPEGEIEPALAEIWAEILEVDRVGATDDFFELGGHSLMATRLAARIHRAFGVTLPLRDLFEARTVRRLAAAIAAAGRSEGTDGPIPLAPRDRPLPLSYAQERLWFLDQLVPGTAFYNIPIAVRIEGDLDLDALGRAFSEIVRRHEALRTTFRTVDGAAVQSVEPAAPLPLAVDEATSEEDIERLASEEARRPFALDRTPLLRVRVLRRAADHHVVLLTLHHIVADGWSMGVLIREMSALYEAFRAGEGSPLPELEIQYADFAAWQRDWFATGVLDRELEYWRERLADLPAMRLPTDRPRPKLQKFRGATRFFSWSPRASERIRRLCERRGATPFMALLAGFTGLLSRYTGQDDLVVGTNLANRSRPELEELIGFFINTVALRTDLSGDPTFLELLERVRETSLEAYEHQNLPFEKLVAELNPERDTSRESILQVVFTMQNMPVSAARTASGLRVSPLRFGSHTAKTDLVLFMWEEGEAFAGSLEYNTDLFDEGTVDEMLARFERLLEAAVEAPERPVSEHDLLAPAERPRLLEAAGPARSSTDDATLADRFVERVAAAPDAVAVSFRGEELTFAELHERAAAVAARLAEAGVGPDVVVGLELDRSLELVVAMVGVTLAGGAYLPLDPAYPEERRRFMREDAAATVLVGPGAVIQGRAHGRPRKALADHLAYVIYTSGSTGRPKGVAISHRAIVNHMRWMLDRFPLTADDRILQKTPFSFDASVWEFWAPLLSGARLVMAEPGRHGDADYLVEAVERESITVLQLVPTVLRAFLDAAPGRRCRTLVRVFSGGEALSPDVRDRFAETLGAELVNLYGPTESTIDALFHVCLSREPLVPIGRPVDGVRAFVIDRHGRLSPPGVPGELALGGAGLARGYLGQPELTAERFVPDPLGQGERLYRTGDRARLRADGAFEFLGRVDDQVKLRGYRIEPGEIEAAIRALPEVRDAAVAVHEDNLTAWVVGDIDPEPLRERLSRRLPEYMVPRHVVPLAELPQLPSGKVDRRALPAPDLDTATTEHEPPVGPTETRVAEIWAELLGLERVGRHDGFFESGGHSLLATQLISRLRRELSGDIELRAIFENPTVAGIAAAIAPDAAQPTDRIPRAPRDRDLSLSFAQERLWFFDQLSPMSPAYNMPSALRLTGRLDVRALEETFGAIVARHEVLRTTFRSVEGRPVLSIASPGPITIPLEDLRDLPEDECEAVVARRIEEEARAPFDLARGPLVRLRLLALADERHVLLATMHHIVSDGWSVGVLLRELTALQEGAPLPELPVQYADFAAWQRDRLQGETLESLLDYWRAQLAEPPVLRLPTDRPRPAMQTFRGATRDFPLDPELMRAVKRFSDARDATPFMTLLAVFQLLLARRSGDEDIVVGSPIAGRDRAEIEGLIGFFVNTLALRTDLGGDPSFEDLLSRVRRTCLDAYEHQEVPFERLVQELAPERSLGHEPLFQVMFVMQNVPRSELRLPSGLTLEAIPVENRQARFDLTFLVLEEEHGVRVSIEYNSDLFDGDTVTRLGQDFRHLLRAVLDAPAARCSAHDLASPAERRRLLTEWNDTAVGYDAGSTITAVFAERVDADPSHPALHYRGEDRSYGELDRQANRLAHRLIAQGVGPETRVGVCLPRGPELVTAVLAVLKAGGAFVPLDPSYPTERIAFMVEDADVATVLTCREAAGVLPPGCPRTEIDDLPETVRTEDDSRPSVAVGGDHLAYVIYTSGSTGRPKGTLCVHDGLCNIASFHGRAFHAGPRSRVLQFASPSFDAFVWELVMALGNGGTLVLADPDDLLPGPGLIDLLRRSETTIATLPPSVLSLLPDDDLPSLRTVIAAGEACPGALVDRWSEGRVFLNAYGPTEITICATWEMCEPGAGAPPIGRPVDNTTAYILDRAGEPVVPGAAGELYIGGVGVTRGYHRRPDLTAERFVPDPFATRPGSRLYRTGDLCRHRKDGHIEFLGRIDDQVKLRGFRIELREIDAALERRREVVQAVSIVREDRPGDRRIVSYVVLGKGAAVAPAALRESLARELPDYMLPSGPVVLDALPLLPNGKIDRRSLPAPAAESSRAYVAPRTGTERTLAAIWSDLLDVPRVGVHDDFFELGGHSLLATRLASRLRDAFSVDLPLRSLFEATTVERLAQAIDAAGPTAAAPPIVRVPRESELPLSFAQERLWFFDQLVPGNTFYNMPVAVRVHGPLDAAALERSFRDLVDRHESLRTVFPTVEGKAVQRIVAAPELPFEVLDLRDLAASLRETEVLRLVREEAKRPFALDRGPLLRVQLVRVGESEHVLLVTMHHIVSDGWSIGVLMRELERAYGAHVAGRPVDLPELDVQYADFAAWQRAWLADEVLEAQLDYWRERLARLPSLELPLDRPRPAVRTFRGARRTFRIPGELRERVEGVGDEENATAFMTWLAVFQMLLARTTRQRDIVVGSPVAGRNRSEIEGLIGFFVNTLVLRSNLDGDPSAREVLSRVRETALGAFAHQDVPFEKLVDAVAPERDLSRESLFQVMFTLQNLPLAAPASGSGIRFEAVDHDPGIAKFDLTLGLERDGDDLRGVLEYNTDLFDAETMDRLATNFEVLASSIADDPDRRLSELEAIGPGERASIARDLEPPPISVSTVSVLRRFEEHAAAHPARPAVLDRGETLDYGELDRRASRLAGLLVERGLVPEERVGILLPRSADAVVAILAVMKAGGAYLPLDPAYPEGRIRFMLEDAGVRLRITDSRAAAPFDGIDVGVARDERLPPLATRDAPGGGRLAYVVYTSGSTGRPKGVMVSHEGLANLVDWHCRTYEVTSDDRATLVAGPAFDASVWELWPYLASGASLYVPADELRTAPDELIAWLTRERIDLTFLPTPLAEAVLERPWPVATRLRALLTGGDRLRRRPAVDLPFRVANHYGPTENTVVATGGSVAPGEDQDLPSIGRPIDNVVIRLLDDEGNPVPRGAAGELCIAGDSLARGYLGRGDLTAERFVPDPGGRGRRLYRTGDLCRLGADGEIDFLGRIDDQVKVRGFRIELGEIEAVLREHPDVRDAAAGARRDAIVAWVVGEAVDADALREHCAASLPDPMIPTWFVSVPELPLTANGKIDRSALPDPVPGETTEEYVAPRNAAEKTLAEIWARVLDVPQVGVHDNFFALGGDSILAIQVVNAARAENLSLQPQQAFQHQTVAELARVVDRGSAVVAEQGEVHGEVSLTPIQRWYFERDPVDPHHFNQSVMVEVPRRLAVETLRRTVSALLEHHDTLRLRFVRRDGGWSGRCDRVDPAAVDGVLRVFDLSHTPAEDRPARVEQEAAAVQSSLDLSNGPLFRVAYFDFGERAAGRLLLVAHHLVVDGVSWRLLLEDLMTVSMQIEGGLPVTLPPKTTSFRAWSHALRERAASPEIAGEREYWAARADEPCTALPLDRPEGRNTAEHRREVGVELTREQTAGLLRGRVEDVLLSAVAGAVAEWTGSTSAWIDVEGHGREAFDDRHDVTRTVGWFTSLYPVRIPAADPVAVRAALDAVPGRGAGFGLLRYASPDPAVRATLSRVPRPELIFNYLGQAGGARKSPVPVRRARESAGPDLSPRADLRHRIHVSAAVADRALHVKWFYSADVHERATIERVVERFREILYERIAAVATEGEPAVDESAAEHLLPLRTEGGRRPLFLVHQAQGFAMSYIPLVRHLHADQPVYGIQAAGLYGERTPIESIEAMAARYIDAILTVDPAGPYRLAGHSFGGHVAFEMARQLEARGRRVSLVAMIDTAAPGFHEVEKRDLAERDDAKYLAWLAGTMERFSGIEVGVDEGVLRELPEDERLEYFLERFARAKERHDRAGGDTALLLEAMLAGGVEALRGALAVSRANGLAHLDYVPETWRGKIVLFRSQDGIPGHPRAEDEDRAMGWDALVSGGTDIEDVPGDHQSIVAEPHVVELAKKLQERLDQEDETTRREAATK